MAEVLDMQGVKPEMTDKKLAFNLDYIDVNRPFSRDSVSLSSACRACNYKSNDRNASKITRFILQRRLTDALNLLDNQGYTGNAAILMIAYLQLGGDRA